MVQQIKARKKEIIISEGIMKLPDGKWVDAVVYKDEENNYFTRELTSFLENFEKCAGLFANINNQTIETYEKETI